MWAVLDKSTLWFQSRFDILIVLLWWPSQAKIDSTQHCIHKPCRKRSHDGICANLDLHPNKVPMLFMGKGGWTSQVINCPACALVSSLTKIACLKVVWPSGLRRWIKAPVSKEAWVQIPPLPFDNGVVHYGMWELIWCMMQGCLSISFSTVFNLMLTYIVACTK